jgi:hypothetical protein
VDRRDDPARPILIGLLTVVAFMSWPVWAAIVAGMRAFTWTVAASAAVPFALSVLVVWIALDLSPRVRAALSRLAHALHVDAVRHRHA